MFSQVFSGHRLGRLEEDLWEVNRQSVLHSVEFEELSDELGHDFAILGLVDLVGDRVLQLEACGLLSSFVCVLLDGLKDLRAQMGTDVAQSAFLLQGLDNEILQIVHCLNFKL